MKAKKLVNQAGALFIEFTIDSKGRMDRCIVEDVPLWPDQWVTADYSDMVKAKRLKANNTWSV